MGIAGALLATHGPLTAPTSRGIAHGHLRASAKKRTQASAARPSVASPRSQAQAEAEAGHRRNPAPKPTRHSRTTPTDSRHERGPRPPAVSPLPAGHGPRSGSSSTASAPASPRRRWPGSERPAPPRRGSPQQLRPSTCRGVREGRRRSTAGSLRCAGPRRRSTRPTRTRPRAAWTYGDDLGNWSILRRIYSERSRAGDDDRLLVHPPAHPDRARPGLGLPLRLRRHHPRERARHASRTCWSPRSLHPAMRLYLDNWKSVKNKPNENQGRELLELHTVGREAGYTEAMVKDSRQDPLRLHRRLGRDASTVRYDSGKHTTGAVQVLGFSHANSAADGQAVTLAYLKYLAHHPATARRTWPASSRRTSSPTTPPTGWSTTWPPSTPAPAPTSRPC